MKAKGNLNDRCGISREAWSLFNILITISPVPTEHIYVIMYTYITDYLNLFLDIITHD